MSIHVSNIIGNIAEVTVSPVKHRVINTGEWLEGLGIKGTKRVSSSQQIDITDKDGNTLSLRLSFKEGANCLAIGGAIVKPAVEDIEEVAK